MSDSMMDGKMGTSGLKKRLRKVCLHPFLFGILIFPGFSFAQNTITVLDTTLNGGRSAAMAIGADGLPVIAYSANFNLKVIKCGNAACNSGNNIAVVDTQRNVTYAVSIGIGVDGYPVIGYFSIDTNPTQAYLNLMKCGDASCESGNSVQLLDTGDIFDKQALLIGENGNPFITYHARNGHLKVVACGDPACSSGNTVTILDSIGPSANLSAAIGRDSLPVIAYSPVDTGVNVVKCGNPQCNLGNVSSVIDTLGRNPAIAIGADGAPVLSYGKSDSLWVAKCESFDCNSEISLTPVEQVLPSVWFNTININSSGMPVLGYSVLDVLFFKTCNNLDCTVSNPASVIDSSLRSEVVALSMEISEDNYPILAYNDGNLWLKVAKCSDSYCTSGTGAVRSARLALGKGLVPKIFPNGVLLTDGMKFYDLRGRSVSLRSIQ